MQMPIMAKGVFMVGLYRPDALRRQAIFGHACASRARKGVSFRSQMPTKQDSIQHGTKEAGTSLRTEQNKAKFDFDAWIVRVNSAERYQKGEDR
jgi:hypothetical protein